MLRLTLIFYIFIAPTLAGLLVLVPMTIYETRDFNPLIFIAFAAAGALIAIPFSWYVAKHVDDAITNKGPTTAA